MTSTHLPILQVIVPLMAAPLCILLRRPGLCWVWALLITLSTLTMAVGLLAGVLAQGPSAYHVGDWLPPWGIELHVDLLSALVLVLVTATASLVIVYARASFAAEIDPGHHSLAYCLFLLCLTGLLGMAITGDAFNLFVFLEISSLSSYALVALGRDRRALYAAYHYLILGTVGATFYVIGIGFLYMMTGTLNMNDLAQRLPAVAHSRTAVAGVLFLGVGLSLKLALFPLHKWLPAAYSYAPSAVGAFLAATSTKVAFYVMVRLFLGVLAPAFSANLLPGPISSRELVMVLALAAILSGSFSAIFQSNAKRLLAYSSVSQIGIMVLGLSLFSLDGVAGGLVHMLNHALIKASLFMALGCVFLRIGSVEIADMAGIGRRMPWTMAAFVIGGLSLIGIPGTAGFISKWQLAQSAIAEGWWLALAALIASSLLAIVYVGKVIEAAYFRPSPAESPSGTQEAPAMMLAPLWIAALANIGFGLNTTWTLGLAKRAAAALMGSPL
ncbi:cation:proton antiporter [Rhodospirillum rubrum]|uniref:monovalent cation/H+ antiporter subunit D family protein n=1 Tax=Rhodospirillum rubrum TaxID=1085 RepID=UPI001906696F|nr:monovalent cation/H+ antiporter subunit D family protein [Rhodospirillum rubrum]MBK1664327.1 cation:proton antiporter [Rhodospirillum rubrum]MBK1676772.1 cation:proton antiporter [Rhodospirillum rubrum]